MIKLLKIFNKIKMSKKVKTIKSETVDISLCRKIEGEYYKVGNRNIKNSGDCYKINGRYYKDNTGYIIFDHFNNRYEIYNSEKFTKGVVKIKKEKLIIGHFLINDLMHTIQDKVGRIYKLMSYTLINDKFYKLDRYYKIYKHINNFSILDSLNFRSVNNDFKRSLNYNINKEIILKCEDLYLSYKDKLPTYKVSEPLSEYLNGLSFGLEFETTKGTIPKKYCYLNGVVPLRDGSIEGLEYVTLPLQGKEGIDSIINITKLLNDYTTFDNSCSLHMHIGNIPRTESFILALFKVLCNVENDFYKMFPLYKRINGGYKKKNYTSPLPAVNLLSKMDSKITSENMTTNFSILFEYLSNGISYSEYNNKLENVYSHPYDPDNNRKWNVSSR